MMAISTVDALYQVTWGRLRLWCSLASSNNGRTQVVHELATGDSHPVQDRGLAPRKTRLSLLFDDFPSETDSALTRFMALLDQIESGVDEIFVHPVRGAYLVAVGDFDYDIDEDSNITNVTLELIASEPIVAVQAIGAGTSPSAGSRAVATRTAAMNALLASDLETVVVPVANDAQAAQDAWDTTSEQGDGVPVRQVLSDVANISAQLADFIDTAGARDDLELWPLYQSAIMLGDAFRASGISQTTQAQNTFTMQIATPISVLALVVRVYGGALAPTIEPQVRQLNDIAAPGGLLPRGTKVIMPSRAGAVQF